MSTFPLHVANYPISYTQSNKAIIFKPPAQLKFKPVVEVKPSNAMKPIDIVRAIAKLSQSNRMSPSQVPHINECLFHELSDKVFIDKFKCETRVDAMSVHYSVYGVSDVEALANLKAVVPFNFELNWRHTETELVVTLVGDEVKWSVNFPAVRPFDDLLDELTLSGDICPDGCVIIDNIIASYDSEFRDV